MKKLISLLIILLVLGSCLSAGAVTPKDGTIANVFGQGGMEVGNATSAGIPLVFSKAGGANWAFRVSYLDAVKLDGLTISPKNVTMADDKAAIVFGFGPQAGSWVDTKGLFFLNFNNKREDTLGSLQYGYVMAKVGNDLSDQKPRVINSTATNKKIEGDVTVSFKNNNDGTWTYSFNGQNFSISDAAIQGNLTPAATYLSFGVWGENTDVSYTIADITFPGIKAPSTSSSSAATSSKPSSSSTAQSASTTASSSSAAVSSSSAVSVSSSSEEISSEANQTGTNSDGKLNPLLIPFIILIFLYAGLVAGGIIIYLNFKKQIHK